MRFGGLGSGWLRRRWWVIVTMTVLVTCAALLAQPSRSTTYTADAVLLVRSGASTNTPGAAGEANRLAVTYGELIPHDSKILERVAGVLGVSQKQVEDHLSVVNDGETSILRVRFEGATSQSAITGARAVADALAGPQPASDNFNGVGISLLPDTATSSSPFNTTLPVGIILGLCLGLVIVFALERSDGRIDSVRDLGSVVSVPVTSLEEQTSTSIVALVHRWVDAHYAHRARPAHTESADRAHVVALLASSEGAQDLTQDVADVFYSVASATPSLIDLNLGSDIAEISVPHVRMIPTGAPGPNEVGELAAQRADVTVLVVAEGTRAQDVRVALHKLADFDVEVSWALFASRAVVRRVERRNREFAVAQSAHDDGIQQTVDDTHDSRSAREPEEIDIDITERSDRPSSSLTP